MQQVDERNSTANNTILEDWLISMGQETEKSGSNAIAIKKKHSYLDFSHQTCPECVIGTLLPSSLMHDSTLVSAATNKVCR